MTRLLVWNIANFGINKFNCPFPLRRAFGAGGLSLFQASKWREQVFARVLYATNPDIIAVIEVSSGDSTPNHLATATGGMDGCIYVLNSLRNTPAFAAGQWRLVPPLRIGQGGKAESVGVFFRGASVDGGGAAVTRYFTGPNVWTGGLAGQSIHPGLGMPVAYPAGGAPDINAMLVPPATVARVIPAGAQYNGLLAEDRVAARTQFDLINMATGARDGQLNFDVFREPYMVTFTETNALGAVQRDLTLFIVHSPAVTGNQAVFLTYLANAYEVVTPNGPNETRIISGDFNVNLLLPNGNDAHEYDDLTQLLPPASPYRLLLEPNGMAPANLDPYRGYFATHVKRAPLARTAASKFLWSNGIMDPAYYPSYGYIGSQFVANLYSIDNMLVRPYNGAHAYNTTIMNPVIGTPFTAVVMPPGNPPQGVRPMGTAFANVGGGIAWPAAPTAPNYAIGIPGNLCSWANYGHIYSTSDHFALYADV